MTLAALAALALLAGPSQPAAAGRGADGGAPAAVAAAAPAGAPVPRVVRCRGTGAPGLRDEGVQVSVIRGRTERAARREAVHACLAALRALPLAGGGTVGAALDADRALAAEVRRAARKGLRVPEGPRYFADGGVRIDAELPLDGDVGRLLPGLASAKGGG